MMYQLIGQLALHLGSLQDKLQEGMVTDVMGDIEGYTNYYSLLEDICNAESSEGYESEFNALSMHIKDVLYKHFLFIEGHKLIQGHWQEHNKADGAVCECMKPQGKHIHQHLWASDVFQNAGTCVWQQLASQTCMDYQIFIYYIKMDFQNQ